MATRDRPSMRRLNFSPQALAGGLVALVAGLLVLYPVAFLLQAALNTGDPEARPPTEYGFENFAGLLAYPQIILNTLTVSFAATVMALILGFVMAWIITRTNVPGRRFWEQIMVVPYYLTPLLGALAWSLLGTPESGFLNQVYRTLGGSGYLININSPYGIAWVMALFEGSVAFVMIGAVMKSMDPALDEASQVLGASRLLTLFYASIQQISTAFPRLSNFTTEHFYKAFTMNAATTALGNSLWLALWTATLGILLMGLISWIVYRSRLPGAAVIEYIVMFPQSVPRLIFAFGMMWAWLIFPIPIYGTLWLLLIAYLTVFLPLGVRTISGVMLQIDKSLEECAQMCGAGWGYRVRTVTIPLLWPGLIAAWLLLFVAR